MVFKPVTKNLDGENGRPESSGTIGSIFLPLLLLGRKIHFSRSEGKERCERETDFYGFVNAALIFANSFLSLSPIPGGDSCH